MLQQAASFLAGTIEDATGRVAHPVRFPDEEAARDGVRYRAVGGIGSHGIDGSAAPNIHFFHVEARSERPFGGRRMADDIVSELGDRCTHVMGRNDWLDVGKIGRDLKRQRTYAHEMTVGIDAEA